MKKVSNNLSKIAVAAFVGITTFSMSLAQAPFIPQTQAGGQTSGVAQSLINLVVQFQNISKLVYSALFTVALIAFFVGIIRLLFGAKDAENHKKSLQFLGIGLVAIFVMVAIWGIVGFLSQTLGIGIGGSGDTYAPGVPVPYKVQ